MFSVNCFIVYYTVDLISHAKCIVDKKACCKMSFNNEVCMLIIDGALLSLEQHRKT